MVIQNYMEETNGFNPYQLVYGKEVMLPIEFKIHAYKLAAKLGLELSEALQQRVMQLNELDEIRQQAVQHTLLVQHQRIKWHDRFIKNKKFHKGDRALLFDSKFKDFKANFTTHWLGPYEIEEIFENGAVKRKTINEATISFLFNGHRLKVYNKPINKEDFLKRVSTENNMEIMEKT